MKLSFKGIMVSIVIINIVLISAIVYVRRQNSDGTIIATATTIPNNNTPAEFRPEDYKDTELPIVGSYDIEPGSQVGIIADLIESSRKFDFRGTGTLISRDGSQWILETSTGNIELTDQYGLLQQLSDFWIGKTDVLILGADHEGQLLICFAGHPHSYTAVYLNAGHCTFFAELQGE